MRKITVFLILLILTGCFETSKQVNTKKYEDRVIDWFKQKDEKHLLFRAGVPTKTYNVSNTDKVLEYYFEDGEITRTDRMLEKYTTEKQYCSVTFFLTNNLIVDGKYKGNICNKLMSSWNK